MIGKEFIRKIALLAVFVVCILGISQVQKQMNQMKKDHDLMIDVEVTTMSPVMAFTTGALGAFRGLVADVLFLRLQHLQEKGAYFEINELGHLILQLQPDMPGAISFLAWNMSYNISVKFSGYDDRWRWVNRGIEIIRDEALKYNKTDPGIYHQLGWTYQHKIGQVLDDANTYYKGQLALQMIEVLGPAGDYDWSKLAAAPDDEDGLKKLLGERLLRQLLLEKTDANRAALAEAVAKLSDVYKKEGKLPEFWQQLFDQHGITAEVIRVLENGQDRQAQMDILDRSLLFIGEHSEFYELLRKKSVTHQKLENTFRSIAEARMYGGLPDELKTEVEELGLTAILDDYFRSRWLRDKYKLDADFLSNIMERVGSLDIRIPESHAIYWAEQGRQYAPDDRQLNRMVQQCLTNSIRYGRLWYLTREGTAVVRPNFDSIQSYFDIYMSQEVHSLGDQSGALNFLKDAVAILYTWGEVEQAQKWLTYLKKSDLKNASQYKNANLEEFALKLASEDAKDGDQKQISAMLIGIAMQRLRAEALDDLDRAERLRQILTRIHQRYYDEMTSNSQRSIDRRRIPTIEQLYIVAKQILLQEEAKTPDLYNRFMRVGPDLQKLQEDLLKKKEADGKMNIQQN